MNGLPDDEKSALLHTLQYQRSSVLSVVAGLSEEAWHTSVVPSGWTPAGFVEHLGGAEYFWFRKIAAGLPDDVAEGDDSTPYDPTAAFVSASPSSEIVQFYVEQCRFSDEVLAGMSLPDSPLGIDPHHDPMPSIRWIVLHMIEETAVHSGHLEIARELLDGETGLGNR